MFSSDLVHSLLKQTMAGLGMPDSDFNNQKSSKSSNQCNQDNEKNKINITPSQAIVIAGLIGGALNVISVLVDKDQTVQIVLEGSLKQKTQLEKMLDQIGAMPFDEVLKALLGRL